MQRLHTHYDNLKVARDAPANVIRAAYKALSQQFHPDRNPGNAEAARIMVIVNAAYAVLSDPNKRKQYDHALEQQEKTFTFGESERLQDEKDARERQTTAMRIRAAAFASENISADAVDELRRRWGGKDARPPAQNLGTRKVKLSAVPKRSLQILLMPSLVLGVLGLVIALFSFSPHTTSSQHSSEISGTRTSVLPPAQAHVSPEYVHVSPTYVLPAFTPSAVVTAPISSSTPNLPQPPHMPPVVAQPRYERPLIAPNGAPWPIGAGYVEGYAQLASAGRSSVTVDNSRNSSAVFVKLNALKNTEHQAVRSFFIPGYQSFTVENVDAGVYDVRYQNLDSGSFSRSEFLTLTENETSSGIEYSTVRLTLYKVRNGNMHTYPISETEF